MDADQSQISYCTLLLLNIFLSSKYSEGSLENVYRTYTGREELTKWQHNTQQDF